MGVHERQITCRPLRGKLKISKKLVLVYFSEHFASCSNQERADSVRQKYDLVFSKICSPLFSVRAAFLSVMIYTILPEKSPETLSLLTLAIPGGS